MPDIIMERSALSKTHAAIHRGKITIGFVGGSITDPEKSNRWSDKVSNWFVYHFRGSEIVPIDLISLGTAMNVANQYNFTITANIVYS